MNKEQQISYILTQLGLSEDADNAVSVLFDALLSEAKAKANRTDTPDALLAIVRDMTVAAYHRRGDEGTTATSAGGQSYSYSDLSDELLRRIIQANLRVFRL